MTHFGVQAHQEEMKHRNRVYMDHHGPSWTSWYLIDIWCHLGVIFAPINCGLSPPFSDNFGSKSKLGRNNPHKSNEISLPSKSEVLHLQRRQRQLWDMAVVPSKPAHWLAAEASGSCQLWEEAIPRLQDPAAWNLATATRGREPSLAPLERVTMSDRKRRSRFAARFLGLLPHISWFLSTPQAAPWKLQCSVPARLESFPSKQIGSGSVGITQALLLGQAWAAR